MGLQEVKLHRELQTLKSIQNQIFGCLLREISRTVSFAVIAALLCWLVSRSRSDCVSISGIMILSIFGSIRLPWRVKIW